EHRRRARGGLGEDGVDLGPPAVGGATGAAQQRALADLGLPAPDRAALAVEAVGVHRHVPPLTREARPARHRLATGGAPPTPTSPQMHSTSSTPLAAPRRTSASTARSASLASSMSNRLPSASSRSAPNGTSRQPRLGANMTVPSERRTMPATPIPMPTMRA